MKKSLLTLSVAIAAMLAANAFAQADKAGETKAAPSAPATAAEKAEAKQARKAEGKTVAKSTKTDADLAREHGHAQVAHQAPAQGRPCQAQGRRHQGDQGAEGPERPGELIVR